MSELRLRIPPPGLDDNVTVTAPRWVFDSLIVAAQIEYERRRKKDPVDAERFQDAWAIVHRSLNFLAPAGEEAILNSQISEWRQMFPDAPPSPGGERVTPERAEEGKRG